MKTPNPIITFVVLFTSVFFLCCLSASAQTPNGRPAIHEQGDPPTVKPGLEIHRDSLIKMITETANDMSFKQAKDVNKLPNYIATNTNESVVQLVGQPDELILAKWTFSFNADTVIDKTELAKITWFAFTMGGANGGSWFISNLDKIKKNINNDFSQTMVFNYNRVGTLKYIKKSKTLILVFNPIVF